MRTIQLKIPDGVNLRDFDFSMIVAAKLFEDAILSTGQAAEIVGLPKRAFIEWRIKNQTFLDEVSF